MHLLVLLALLALRILSYTRKLGKFPQVLGEMAVSTHFRQIAVLHSDSHESCNTFVTEYRFSFLMIDDNGIFGVGPGSG